jgi:hypothetical protein
MKLRFLVVLFSISVLSFMAVAQETSSSRLSNLDAQFARTQQATPPQRIEPGSLHILPQSTVSDVLSVRADMGLAAASTFPKAGTALPLFTYSDHGNTGTIVGTTPGTAATTSISAIIVPVVINITQGGHTFSFNPNVADGCLGTNNATNLFNTSPFFQAVPVSMNGVSEGTVQYLDAFQRAEFQTSVNSAHHTNLSQTVGATLTVSINGGSSGSTSGAVFSVGGCGGGTIGVVNINTINTSFVNYISAHGINASQLPIFMLYNAVMSNGAANNLNNCCILGFHNALGNSTTAPGQTYAVSDFQGNPNVFTGVSDTAVMAHELGEWANDPSGLNPVSGFWGNIGQVSGCQSNFEVGDPLSGTLAPAISHNGFTYNFQELAFFSWFFRDSPSQGAGGKYSSNGTFSGFSKACPPGGTN